MHLETLHLLSFKNYAEANLRFSPRINVLVGKNGSGKTNLAGCNLLFSLHKECFFVFRPAMYYTGAEFFFSKRGISGRVKLQTKLSAPFRSGLKKSFEEDTSEYQKLSEHIGKYPVVLIAPDDVDLGKRRE